MIPVIFISIVFILVTIMFYKTFVVTNHNYKQKDSVSQTTVEPKPLLCYDCNYCIKIVEFGKDNSKCSKVIKDSKSDLDYLVTGKMSTSGDTLHDKYFYCSTHRSSVSDTSMCQAEAKFFEPKVVQEKTNG